MKIAFYKGTHKGWKGFADVLIRWWLNGKYSHAELIFHDGISASSSYLDGGVRFKQIVYHPDRWDIVDIGGDEDAARDWFVNHLHLDYDMLGAMGFVTRFSAGSNKKVFCTEAIFSALGFKETWRIDPCTARIIVDRINRVWAFQ